MQLRDTKKGETDSSNVNDFTRNQNMQLFYHSMDSQSVVVKLYTGLGLTKVFGPAIRRLGYHTNHKLTTKGLTPRTARPPVGQKEGERKRRSGPMKHSVEIGPMARGTACSRRPARIFFFVWYAPKRRHFGALT